MLTETPNNTRTKGLSPQYNIPKESDMGIFGGMKVKVRSVEKCIKCGGKFALTVRGLVCINHPKSQPNHYYLDWYYLGERFKLFGFHSFKEAVMKANSIEQEITEHKFRRENYKGQTAKVNKKFAFKERFDTWMKIRNRDFKPGTNRKIEQYRKEYVAFFGREDVRSIGADRIASYHESMFGKTGNKTQYNKMGMLHSFFNSLYKREAINTMPRFPKVKFKKNEPVWINEDKQQQLLNAMPEQHRAIFIFLFGTGCRHGEVRALHWEDVDLKKGIINIRHNFSNGIITTPKTGEERKIPMTSAIKKLLIKQPRTLHSPFVFNLNGKPYYESSLGKIWRPACEEVGIEGVRPYDGTRHSFASQLVNRGKSLEIIGEILGHSDPRTTKKYAHVNMDAMLDAMES